jgi:hypothetical protein
MGVIVHDDWFAPQEGLASEALTGSNIGRHVADRHLPIADASEHAQGGVPAVQRATPTAKQGDRAAQDLIEDRTRLSPLGGEQTRGVMQGQQALGLASQARLAGAELALDLTADGCIAQQYQAPDSLTILDQSGAARIADQNATIRVQHRQFYRNAAFGNWQEQHFDKPHFVLVTSSLWQELTEGAADKLGGSDAENRLGSAGRGKNVVVRRKQNNRVCRLRQHSLKPARLGLTLAATRLLEPAVIECRPGDDQGWSGGCSRERTGHMSAELLVLMTIGGAASYLSTRDVAIKSRRSWASGGCAVRYTLRTGFPSHHAPDGAQLAGAGDDGSLGVP